MQGKIVAVSKPSDKVLSSSTIRIQLKLAVEKLSKAEISTPYLDAVIILAHVIGISKEQLFARYPDRVSNFTVVKFHQLLARRLLGEPVAYLCSNKEFYGRTFTVNKEVLIPRPETELLVEVALKFGDSLEEQGRSLSVHDVGTGSGAIALTLQLEREQWKVSASDVSPFAVSTALKNRDQLGAHKLYIQLCDLLPRFPKKWDVVVGNLPYLSSDEVHSLKASGWQEPSQALDGGSDGLRFICRLIDSVFHRLKVGGGLVLEFAPEQASPLCHYLKKQGFDSKLFYDLAGYERVLLACRE